MRRDIDSILLSQYGTQVQLIRGGDKIQLVTGDCMQYFDHPCNVLAEYHAKNDVFELYEYNCPSQIINRIKDNIKFFVFHAESQYKDVLSIMKDDAEAIVQWCKVAYLQEKEEAEVIFNQFDYFNENGRRINEYIKRHIHSLLGSSVSVRYKKIDVNCNHTKSYDHVDPIYIMM